MFGTVIIVGLIWSVGVLVGVVATEMYYGRLRDELADARTRLRWKDVDTDPPDEYGRGENQEGEE
tara:strand:- start:431 stop:625 length:195 start_codon:yes stop_codon:yes gene_type:complete